MKKVQPETFGASPIKRKTATSAADFLDWSRRSSDGGATPQADAALPSAAEASGVHLESMPWEALATTTLYDHLWWPNRMAPKPVVFRPDGASSHLDTASNRLCLWRDVSHPSRPAEAPVLKVGPTRIKTVEKIIEKEVPVMVEKVKIVEKIVREGAGTHSHSHEEKYSRPVRVRVVKQVAPAPERCCCLAPLPPCKPCCEFWTEYIGEPWFEPCLDGGEKEVVVHDQVHFDPWMTELPRGSDPTVRSGCCCWCWPLCWPRPAADSDVAYTLLEVIPTPPPRMDQSMQVAHVRTLCDAWSAASLERPIPPDCAGTDDAARLGRA